MPPVLSIVGHSNTGKTTLIEKLIREFKQLGYRIGVIKHASHGFDIDHKGKDSWRHHAAGADAVMVTSQNQMALFKNIETDDIDSLISFFGDVDIVFTEGFKRQSKPKIEIYRPSVHPEPICLHDKNLIAIVTDSKTRFHIPTFSLEEIHRLAGFIIDTFKLDKSV